MPAATYRRRLNGCLGWAFIDILGKRVFPLTPKMAVFGFRIVDSDAPGAIQGSNVKMGKAKRATFVALFSETRENAPEMTRFFRVFGPSSTAVHMN